MRGRIVLVGALGVVVALVAGGIFDQYVAGLLLPPMVIATVAVVLVGRRRWWWNCGLWGGAIVSVIIAVLIEDGSTSDVGTGLWSGPRRLLTTEWPSPLDPSLVASIAALIALATVIAIELAVLPRWHLAPLVPMIVALVVVIALGAPVQPAWWLIGALGVLSAALALARDDQGGRAPREFFRKDRTLVASAIVVVVVSLVASGALAWADRADPRQTEEASSSAALLDPIEATVALREADPELELYRVTDRSALIGSSLPARWRIAALDTYDGQRWVPRLTLRPIGGRLGLAEAATLDVQPPVRYDLTLLTDDLDLLPFPGRPLQVDADVETDLDRVVVRLSDRPTPGMVVAAESEVAPTAAISAGSTVVPRPVDELAGSFTEQARSIAGSDVSVLEQLRNIEATMRSDWQLDSEAPGGGQQLALVERFVTDTQRGTREQFVTAFVLLARSLGSDARVATGFIVPPDEVGEPLTIRSDQAAVWPEVRLEGVGWLAFDPVPPVEATDDEEPPPPPDAQSPAAAQPPIAPPAEESEDDDQLAVDLDQGGSRWDSVRTWFVRAAAVTGVALLPVVLVVATILILKWRRRRRRLRAQQPALQVRGAWANTTDSLVDAGLSIVPAWTDDTIAGAAAPLAPGSPHEMRRLAAMSSAMTFGSTADAGRLVDDARLTSSAVDDAIRANRTRWKRIVWRLSLRSFRRSTRSPVRV